MFPRLENIPVASLDTETTGLKWQEDEVFGVALSVPGEDWYWDVRKEPQVLDWLRDQVVPNVGKFVNHHMKFDLHMLREAGVEIDPAKCECTMIRSALIDEHRKQYDLDSLGRDYLKERKHNSIYQELADMFGGTVSRKAQMPNLHRAPVSMVSPYAKADTNLALRLWQAQEKIIDTSGLTQVWNLEQRLFPHVIDMEQRGIRVDPDAAERQIQALTLKINDLQAQLNATAGFTVNPNPSGSIHRLFEPYQSDGKWYAIDGTPLLTTGAGRPSLGADALKAIKHPAAPMVLKLRKLLKARDTFIRGHILGHMTPDGYVHPNINQTKGDETGGTGTGRLSYTDPALQQIPARDKEIAALIRPIFLPDEDQQWSYGDLDQHELRIFHHFVNNPKIVAAYAADPDTDGHTAVAELTGLPRNAPEAGGANAKQVNLGMIFNMGGGELADRMGLPFTWDTFEANGVQRDFKKPGPEAQEIMDKYYRQVPGVKEIAKKARAVARSRGYVRTLKGRHIRFPGGQFTHKASGLIYQGSAADLNKENICTIMEYFKAECPENRLLLNIHDEYSMSLAKDGKEATHLKNIKNLIQDRPELRVPLRIDFSVPSANWWDATKAEIITK